MKKFWCSYTCSANKTKFVNGTGIKSLDIKGIPTNFTEVTFSVDDTMACTLF